MKRSKAFYKETVKISMGLMFVVVGLMLVAVR